MSRVSRILQRATDPYVEIETTVPHRDTRAVIFKIPRAQFFVTFEEVSSCSPFSRDEEDEACSPSSLGRERYEDGSSRVKKYRLIDS